MVDRAWAALAASYLPQTDAYGYTYPHNPPAADCPVILRITAHWGTAAAFDALTAPPQQHRSVAEEAAWRLAQAARGRDRIGLDKCFDLHCTREQLGADDMWYCRRCEEHRPAFKELRLMRAPRVLIVHLKRFSQGGRKRNSTPVDFPHVFDIAPWLVPDALTREVLPPASDRFRAEPVVGPPQTVYDLYGVVHHTGSLHAGHYTASVLNTATMSWMLCDDRFIDPLPGPPAADESAYMLFYARRNPDGTPSLRAPRHTAAPPLPFPPGFDTPPPPGEASGVFSSTPLGAAPFPTGGAAGVVGAGGGGGAGGASPGDSSGGFPSHDSVGAVGGAEGDVDSDDSSERRGGGLRLGGARIGVTAEDSDDDSAARYTQLPTY